MGEPWKKYGQSPDGPWTKYTTPAPTTIERPQFTEQRDRVNETYRRAKELVGLHPDGDYSRGINDFNFRFEFGRADTDEERAAYLDQRLGAEGWGQDRAGNYLITPEGIDRLGLDPSDVPVALDEKGIKLGDLADVGEQLPGVAAGVGAGIATAGAGLLPALLAAGAASMATKVGVETVETLQGRQKQSPSEILDDAASSGMQSAVGEAGARALSHVGGRILGPHTKRPVKLLGSRGVRETTIDPERIAAVDAAIDIGGVPHTREATGKNIAGRMQSATEYIVGTPRKERNINAILSEQDRITKGMIPTSPLDAGESARLAIRNKITALEKAAEVAQKQSDDAIRNAHTTLRNAYGTISAEDAGNSVKKSISTARKTFSVAASRRFSAFDAEVGDQPIFNISEMKRVARRWLDEMPVRTKVEDYDTGLVNEAGEAIIGQRKTKETVKSLSPEGVARLEAILSSDTLQTAQQVHTMSTLMRELAEDPSMAPGVPKGIARDLHQAANSVLQDETNVPAHLTGKWRENVKWYARNIQKFDNATVKRIMADAKYGGSVNPEDVVDFIVKPNSLTELRTVRSLVSPETWNSVRSVHRQKLFDSSKDVSGEINPTQFYNKVKSLGKSLDVLYGASDAAQIEKFARVLSMRGGKIPVSSTKGNLYEGLRKAAAAAEARDAYLSQNFVKELTSPSFEAERFVDFLSQPGRINFVKQAKNTLGEGSIEWAKIRSATVDKLLKSQLGVSDDGIKTTLFGDGLRKALDSYSPESLKELLGEQHYNDLYKLARATQVLVPRRAPFTGAIAAAHIAMHPLSNLGALAQYMALTRLFASPKWVQYMTKGFTAPRYFEDATRIATQVAAQVSGMEQGDDGQMQGDDAQIQ